MTGWAAKFVCAGAIGAALLVAGCGARGPLDRPSLQPYEPLMKAPAHTRGPLNIWFLGSSTIVLRDEETTILTDGFFTRPSTLPMLLSPLKSDPDRVNDGLRLGGFIERPQAQVLFVAHAHHDHVLDSAIVATKTGATLIGDSSSVNVALAVKLEGNVCVAGHGDRFEIGKFTVRVFKTPHPRGTIGPIKGRIATAKPQARWLADYRTRTSHAYHIEHEGSDGVTRRILIVPSANFDWDSSFGNVKADVVFLAVAKLHELSRDDRLEFWVRSVERPEAKLVIPIHWDDIRAPLARDDGRARPFDAIPYAQDDFRRAMAILLPLALRKGVEVRIPIEPGAVQAGPLDREGNPTEPPWWPPIAGADTADEPATEAVPWRLPNCGKKP